MKKTSKKINSKPSIIHSMIKGVLLEYTCICKFLAILTLIFYGWYQLLPEDFLKLICNDASCFFFVSLSLLSNSKPRQIQCIIPLHGGGLAGPVVAEEGGDLSLVEVDAQVVDGQLLALTVHLLQVLDRHAQLLVLGLSL